MFKDIAPFVLIGILTVWSFTSGSKETTPLDDIVNAPSPAVKVFVDNEHHVVCYYIDRNSISCVPMKE
jgi:hypothetical protein